jgi:hypothetical protein
VAKAAIWANRADESIYFQRDLDREGDLLDGTNGYTITFDQGMLPPVRGLVADVVHARTLLPRQRPGPFPLGTKNGGLSFDPDARLVLQIEREPPIGQPLSNSLPAPKGGFALFLRAYWPSEQIPGGTWPPPAVARVGITRAADPTPWDIAEPAN